MNEQRYNGTIKRFFDGKGYGFIAPGDGGDDIFFHYSQVEGGKSDSLREGKRVSFCIMKGAKGRQANGIKVLNEAAE